MTNHKPWRFFRALAGLSCLLLLLGACSSSGTSTEQTGDGGTATDAGQGDLGQSSWPLGETIEIDEVKRLLDAKDPDMLLVNVVGEQFHSLGHIPGSLVIPFPKLEAGYKKIDQSKHVVIYCRAGTTAGKAYPVLKGKGFTKLWRMKGGILDWKAKGYPVE